MVSAMFKNAPLWAGLLLAFSASAAIANGRPAVLSAATLSVVSSSTAATGPLDPEAEAVLVGSPAASLLTIVPELPALPQVRSFKPGETVREVLMRWVEGTAWQLSWELPYDIQLRASAEYKQEKVDEAVAQLVTDLRGSGKQIFVGIYEGNHMFRILAPNDRPELP